MKFLFIPTSTTTLDSSNNMWIVLCGYIKILSTCKKIKALLKLLKSNVVIPSPHMIFIVSHNFKILHNYKKKIQTMMASGTHEHFSYCFHVHLSLLQWWWWWCWWCLCAWKQFINERNFICVLLHITYSCAFSSALFLSMLEELSLFFSHLLPFHCSNELKRGRRDNGLSYMEACKLVIKTFSVSATRKKIS